MHTVVMFSVSLTERKLQNEVRMEQPEREAASTAEKKKQNHAETMETINGRDTKC